MEARDSNYIVRVIEWFHGKAAMPRWMLFILAAMLIAAAHPIVVVQRVMTVVIAVALILGFCGMVRHSSS